MSTLLKRKHVLAAYATGAFSGAASYQSKVLGDGASNYWPLDDPSGLTFRDAVGGRTATGVANTGVTFRVSAPDGGIGIATSGVLNPFNYTGIAVGTTCTIEFWFRSNNTFAGYHGIVGGDPIAVYHLPNTTDGGRINVFFTTDHLNNTILALNTLYHVAVSINAGNGTIYINGVADGTFTGWPGTTFLHLAKMQANESFVTTLFDEVAIYPTALSPSQILSHYQARSG